MKQFRLLTLTIAFLFIAIGSLQAQCVPDTNGTTTPGIYPGDTLPDGSLGQPYSQVIQLVFAS